MDTEEPASKRKGGKGCVAEMKDLLWHKGHTDRKMREAAAPERAPDALQLTHTLWTFQLSSHRMLPGLSDSKEITVAQPQSMQRQQQEEEGTWDDPLWNVFLQLGAHFGLGGGVPVGAVVNQQQMGVIVIQAVQGVSLQVIHDVVGQVAPLGAHTAFDRDSRTHTPYLCGGTDF